VGVSVHGRPGETVATAGERYGPAAARRGRFFEQQVAGALARWLSNREDHLHLFHDLSRLRVSGAALEPLDLGHTNIDHVVLSGSGWLMIDAKGCGAGILRLGTDGRGVLVDPQGGIHPQPWMDNRSAYAPSGALFRLTRGKPGVPVWVVPDATAYDEQTVGRATFLSRGGTILRLSEVIAGELDQLLPVGQLPAEPADVARLVRHVNSR
jgi:hypothetical protein